MVTTITAVLGICIAVGTLIFGYTQYRHTVHMSIFRTYADKYNSIITAEMYDKWQSALSGNQDQWEALTPRMIEYLNLIWEEIYLYHSHVIPSSLWRIWQPEIDRVLATDFAKKTIGQYGFHFPKDITASRRVGALTTLWQSWIDDESESGSATSP